MGKYFFRVSVGDASPNYDLMCRQWFWEQRNYWWMVVWGWMYTRVCPCDQRRVLRDRRWKFDFAEFWSSHGERVCYYERRPWWFSTQVRGCVCAQFGLRTAVACGRVENYYVTNNRQVTICNFNKVFIPLNCTFALTSCTLESYFYFLFN